VAATGADNDHRKSSPIGLAFNCNHITRPDETQKIIAIETTSTDSAQNHRTLDEGE